MSKPKHTPGPWSYSKIKDGHDCHITGAGDAAVITTDHFEVSDADARLITAAPEMLQALRTVEVWMSTMPRPGGTDLLDIVRYAIEKAEGNDNE